MKFVGLIGQTGADVMIVLPDGTEVTIPPFDGDAVTAETVMSYFKRKVWPVLMQVTSADQAWNILQHLFARVTEKFSLTSEQELWLTEQLEQFDTIWQEWFSTGVDPFPAPIVKVAEIPPMVKTFGAIALAAGTAVVAHRLLAGYWVWEPYI
jgi:hypothetical protein